MRVTGIETIPAGRWLFVKVHTDEGLDGVGESGLTGRQKTVEAAVKELERYLLGKNPLDIEHHWQSMYRNPFFRGGPILMAAISAVDTALWDIAGKWYEAPVHRLLGGPTRNRVRVYTAVPDNLPPGELAEKAREQVENGFTAVRWAPFAEGFERKRLSSVIEDAVSQVRAVREAIGNGVDICLDNHGRLSPWEAIALAKELERFRVFFLEDPVLPENVAAMAEVAAKVSIPIATGERLYTIWSFSELLEKRAAHMVRPDLCLAGGVSGCKKIAAIAEAHYAGVVPHNPLGPVSTAACVQLDACIPNFTIQEGGIPRRVWSEAVVEPISLENGYLLVPDKPGLGVELDEKVSEIFPYQPADLPALLHEDGSVADW